MFKTIKELVCKECEGKGYVMGTSARATCIFCDGQTPTDHGSRLFNRNLKTIYKWCEDFIDGKKDGWYH